MYKHANKQPKTSIIADISYEAETIEQKVNRILNNKEPITDGAPLIYTDRSEGTKPEHNIRTDRWELAIDAMDLVSKQHQAKRQERADAKIVDINKKNEGGAQPTASDTTS